jgi:hypothetical protein
MKQVNPVGWFDLYVADLDRAKKFYESVFRLTLTELPLEWGRQALFPFHPDAPNISGALVEKKDYRPVAGNTLVYFETEDCLREEEKIAALGGKILTPKMSIGEFGFVSIAMDSEGNTIGLHSRR